MKNEPYSYTFLPSHIENRRNNKKRNVQKLIVVMHLRIIQSTPKNLLDAIPSLKMVCTIYVFYRLDFDCTYNEEELRSLVAKSWCEHMIKRMNGVGNSLW